MARQAGIFKSETFRLDAPEAQKVLLVGDFTNWQERAIPMKQGKDGVWTTTVGLPTGTHHYLFIVDGQWQDDPECVLRAPNSFGSQNMVRQVM